jgi:hypothetical protein
MATIINEASTCEVTARFYDSGNSPVVPDTVRYLIRDVTNDRIVKDWTSTASGTVISIDISASDNEVHESHRRRTRFEKRVVTVQANAGQASQRSDEIEYWIKNLHGIED